MTQLLTAAELEIGGTQRVGHAFRAGTQLQAGGTVEELENPEIAERVHHFGALIGWSEHDNTAQLLGPALRQPCSDHYAAQRMVDEMDFASVAAHGHRRVDMLDQLVDWRVSRRVSLVDDTEVDRYQRFLKQQEGRFRARQSVNEYHAILRQGGLRKHRKQKCDEDAHGPS